MLVVQSGHSSEHSTNTEYSSIVFLASCKQCVQLFSPKAYFLQMPNFIVSVCFKIASCKEGDCLLLKLMRPVFFSCLVQCFCPLEALGAVWLQVPSQYVPECQGEWAAMGLLKFCLSKRSSGRSFHYLSLLR